MTYAQINQTTEYRYADVAREPVVSVAPTSEPITLEDMKSYARETGSYEDDVFLRLIKDAREQVEHDTSLAIMPQTLILYLDRLPDWQVELRRFPVVAVSSVVYLDSSNVSTTLDSSLYRLDFNRRPAILTPAFGQTWPLTYDVTGAVAITFTAGYATPDLIPESVKQAVRVKALQMHEDRTGLNSEAAEKTYWRIVSKLQTFGVV